MELLKEIKSIFENLATVANGCTGEKSFLDCVSRILSGNATCEYDGMGNLIVSKPCDIQKKKLLVAFNVDCPSLIATYTDKQSGKISVKNLGQTPPSAWLGAQVVFDSGAKGVVLRKNDGDKSPESFDELCIKTYDGMAAEQGEVAIMCPESTGCVKKVSETEVYGYATASKLIAATAVRMAKNLAENPDLCVYIAFCVQGELMSRGLEAVVNGIRPDYAVLVRGADKKIADGITLVAKEKSGVYDEDMTKRLCRDLGAKLAVLDEGMECGMLKRAGCACAKILVPCSDRGTCTESVDVLSLVTLAKTFENV